MIGLLVGVDSLPTPSEFQTLLDGGDLVPGLQYVTIEVTRAEARDTKFLTTMYQGAVVQHGGAENVFAALVFKKAKVNGKPVVVVYPRAAAPQSAGTTEEPQVNGLTGAREGSLVSDIVKREEGSKTWWKFW